MIHTAKFPASIEGVAIQNVLKRIDPEPDTLELTRDSLTGLLDRKSFISFASNMLDQRNEVAFAIADLDDLKRANDRFGHAFGDQYISKFASIISTLESESCCVGRLGGDEFAIIFIEAEARRAIARISNVCKEFQSIDFENEFPMAGKVSVGVHMLSGLCTSFSDLYQKADVALYAAKENGRGQVKIYSDFIRNHFDVKYQESILYTALASEGVIPALQPIVQAESGEVVGYEALARIRLADGVIQKPNKFLKGLRNRKCAKLFSRRMVELCFQSWKIISASLPPGSRLSINVTEYDIADFELLDFIELSLRKYSLDWSDITLEVVETAILEEDLESKICVLKEFRSRGAKIALDDFGTGYASLTHLVDFPLDIVKIDRVLTREVAQNRRARRVLSFILQLADSLQIDVIVEGIEGDLELDVAIEAGAKFAQGYFFEKPKCAKSIAILASAKRILSSNLP